MAEELTGLERAMIQMILTDRWNPSRLNRKIANHFELTIDEVCCIRQRPAFMAGLERQRQISEQDFVPLADRLERVVALQQLFERVPDARVALRMKILREIRTLVLDDKYVLGAPARDTAPPPSQTYAEWLESEVKPISK